MQEEIERFLRESNAIEGVYDQVSLIQARYAWDCLMRQETLTPDIILKTHEILMKHQNLPPHEKGRFRTVYVSVAGQLSVRPEKIPELIRQFCADIMQSCDWKAMHIRYEKIHPFVDGNGRTGRMVMNWHRVRRCSLPVLVVKADERWDYYTWFR